MLQRKLWIATSDLINEYGGHRFEDRSCVADRTIADDAG